MKKPILGKKTWIEISVVLAIFFAVVLFGAIVGPVATPVRVPNPADLAVADILNWSLNDDINIWQEVRIKFDIHKGGVDNSYFVSHNLVCSPTSDSAISLMGTSDKAEFNKVFGRIQKILKEQGVKAFEGFRNESRGFCEATLILVLNNPGQKSEWNDIWRRIFAQYPKYFYNLQIESIEDRRVPEHVIGHRVTTKIIPVAKI